MIYGAGISGLITKRTIEKDVNSAQKIVGFLDDNSKLAGNRLEGVTIYPVSQLEKVIQKEGVDLVIIAIQSPDKESKNRVVEKCLQLKVEVRKVPTTKSWINGEFLRNKLLRLILMIY